MSRRALIVSLFLLLSCAQCFGQRPYKGLTPGQSTKSDVERVLGQAVRQLTETLAEYKSDKGTEQIFVQYLRDSGIIARIEAAYAETVGRASVLASLNLPPRSTAWQINSKSRLE